MGINNLAVQTFSSSGSQSVCRANKADSSRQITSEFISRCPVQYIHGSGLSIVPGTLTFLPYTNFQSEIFRIPNNIDSISEMVLNLELNISAPTTAFDASGIYYSQTFLLDIIDNIEIRVGGLLVQTITAGDIYMRNYAELGTLLSSENSFNNIRDTAYIDTGSIIAHETTTGENISFSLSLPFIGRNKNKERSFLQTGSFTKNLTVTVNYNPLNANQVLDASYIPLLYTMGAGSTTRMRTNLCILSHIITDTEKNFIKQNIINRVLNTSSSIVLRRIASTYSISSAVGNTRIDVDLDPIDVNMTHLAFCLNINIFDQAGVGYPTQTISSYNGATDNFIIRPTTIRTEALGANRLSSTWGEGSNDTNANFNNFRNRDILGVFDGWLVSAELILGTETTGEIQSSVLSSNQEDFNLKNIDKNFYILKMADNAFSTAGIPFSRIKNKRLILTVRNKFFANGIGTYQALSAAIPIVTTAIRDATITICACGTTLQIINNNNISFSYI